VALVGQMRSVEVGSIVSESRRSLHSEDVPTQVARVFRIKRLSSSAKIRIAVAAGIDPYIGEPSGAA
jgi:hypothetical protein